MSRKLIVFAPHPDDETLGCGGTIIKKAKEGYEITIVVMTDGRNALSTVFGINSNPTPEELKLIRIEEIKRALAILGVTEEKLMFFNFEDGDLWQNRKEAEERVTEILGKISPAEVYFPCQKEYNADHRAANYIILDSLRRVGSSTLKYEYSITQKYARVGPFIDRLENIFKHNLVAVDVSEFLPLKDSAIKEFRSQITTISDKQKRPVLTKIGRFLKSKEVFNLV